MEAVPSAQLALFCLFFPLFLCLQPEKKPREKPRLLEFMTHFFAAQAWQHYVVPLNCRHRALGKDVLLWGVHSSWWASLLIPAFVCCYAAHINNGNKWGHSSISLYLPPLDGLSYIPFPHLLMGYSLLDLLVQPSGTSDGGGEASDMVHLSATKWRATPFTKALHSCAIPIWSRKVFGCGGCSSCSAA